MPPSNGAESLDVIEKPLLYNFDGGDQGISVASNEWIVK
jgi:hypothetical protein